MKSVNKVTLLGAVGQDPEIRCSQQGLTIATFSLATSEKRKNKEEVTAWHNCVAFGTLAEVIQKYIKKGSKMYLEGTIQYQQYEKEGEKRIATKIVVNDISMLSFGDSGNQGANPHKQKAADSDNYLVPKGQQQFDDSEIPF